MSANPIPSSEVLLSARGLTKRFGGLAAVNGVNLDLVRDHIHAVIGPNGAGKSTLTNLLSGDILPTAGTVTLGGSNQIMVVRVCALQHPIFPSTGIGLGLRADSVNGGYQLMASTVVVNEPR